MKVRGLLFSMLCMLALSVSFSSCSHDNDNGRDDGGSTVKLPQVRAYILNEGSINNNNAGIAFYAPNKDADFIGDIYKKQNKAALGDTGQDMIKYEDYIYVSVYKSNRLVKLNAAGVEQKSISFVTDADLSGGIRYLAAKGDYIYASFYGGVVAKINANTLEVEKKLTGHGDNLEGVAISGDLLYVANSWKKEGPNTIYNTEVFVYDLNSFTFKEALTVVQNPNKLMESNGKLFLVSHDYSSQGGYVLQMIDPANNQVTRIDNTSYMAAGGEVLYLINSLTDYTNKIAVNTFFTYNIRTGEKSETSFLKNPPDELVPSILHMLEVNENNGDIYISTSDFKTNGTIYRFKKDGTFVEKFDAGGINPNTAIFFN